jgi:hypothetical protein
VKKNMNFMFVERMDEVLHLALLRPVANELADQLEPPSEAPTAITPSVSPADRVSPSTETVIGSD